MHFIGPRDECPFTDDRVEIHDETPRSDDGIDFKILDLPGVADSENKGDKQDFNKLTAEFVTECDIVCWVLFIAYCPLLLQ